jgi:hypothetical protein
VSLTLREALAAPQGGTVRGHLLQYVTPHPGATTALRDGDVLRVLGGLEALVAQDACNPRDQPPEVAVARNARTEAGSDQQERAAIEAPDRFLDEVENGLQRASGSA